MLNIPNFPSVCRVCFKPTLDCNINSPVKSGPEGCCLTYEDFLNELTFIPQEDYASNLPSYLCSKCVCRLDEFLTLRQQTILILKFSIALVDTQQRENSQPMIDLFKEDGDTLRQCLKRLNIVEESDFSLNELLEEPDRCLSTEKEECVEPNEESKFEEVKKEDQLNPSSQAEEESSAEASELEEVESEHDEPRKKRKKQKNEAKTASKIIRRDGLRFKVCILEGCNEEYEVGNRAAYLEHEKIFHRYACNLCGRVLASRTSFRNHVLLHDGEEAKVKCEFCERTFTTKGSMMVHVREVHNNTGIHFNCQYCGIGFMEQKDLFAHLHEHRECKICEEQFADLTGWLNHNRRQHPDMLFTCDHCDHTSLSRALLDRHKRMKHSESSNEPKPQRFTIYAINEATFHQCPQCNLQFTTEEFLLQHNEQAHNRPQGEKQGRPVIKRRSREEREKFALRYKCDVCGKMYRFKNSLWSHKHKEHNMAKQIAICDVCGQHFKHHSYLTAHLAYKHATELPFQCEFCSKAYSQAYLLKEHMKSHDSAKKYKCPNCDYRSKQSHALKDHIIRMHTTERPAKCTLCDKGFINNNDLRKHMAVHNEEMPFHCEECDQVFRRKMDLGRHRSRVHLGVASKKRRASVPVDDGIAFNCVDCGLEFKRKTDLTRHNSRSHVATNDQEEKVIVKPELVQSSRLQIVKTPTTMVYVSTN